MYLLDLSKFKVTLVGASKYWERYCSMELALLIVKQPDKWQKKDSDLFSAAIPRTVQIQYRTFPSPPLVLRAAWPAKCHFGELIRMAMVFVRDWFCLSGGLYPAVARVQAGIMMMSLLQVYVFQTDLVNNKAYSGTHWFKTRLEHSSFFPSSSCNTNILVTQYECL